MADEPERVGIVLVHGIGEQRRFEHLEGHIRGLVEALKARSGAKVHVEVLGGPGAAYHAEQATWHGGPEGVVRVIVRERGRPETHLHLHEVWWADVNEEYSLIKQIRFWLWGLSVWNYPASRGTDLASARAVTYLAPKDRRFRTAENDVRIRLFGVAVVFLLGSLTVGLATSLAKRLLNFGPPDLVRVFVNYLSAVKLYNQCRRGAGWRSTGGEFLDTLDDPPRVSIRRRMARVLAEVACQDYDRWYVLGHSQGSVVALNGLMEPAWAWPGYLDEEQWRTLRARAFAGPAPSGWDFFPENPAARTMPPRPPWAGDHGIVYRDRLFARCRGLFTYGSPLGKFAAIWPARVPIGREPAFSPDAEWLNAYDPLDPVSGPLRDFVEVAPGAKPSALGACPPLRSVGYAASRVLLLGHIRYLRRDPAGRSLADGVAKWLLTGDSSGVGSGSGPRFFAVDDATHRWRDAAAYAWWGAVLVGSALLAVLFAALALWLFVGRSSGWRLLGWLAYAVPAVILAAGAVTLLAGWIAKRKAFRGANDC